MLQVSRPPQRGTREIAWIALNKLIVGWKDANGRFFRQSWADQIAANFDPDKFGTLTVCPYDGDKYHVIDGLHRKNAAEKALGKGQRVPCEIIAAADQTRAAEIFLGVNGGRRHISGMEKFLVAVTAKREPETTIHNAVSSLGFKIAMGSSDNCIRAVETLTFICRKHDIAHLRDVLTTIRATYGDRSDAYDAIILRGFSMLLSSYGSLDRSRLAKKLSKKFTPQQLIGEAKAVQEVFKGKRPSAIEALIRQTYNDGLRTGRLEAASRHEET